MSAASLLLHESKEILKQIRKWSVKIKKEDMDACPYMLLQEMDKLLICLAEVNDLGDSYLIQCVEKWKTNIYLNYLHSIPFYIESSFFLSSFFDKYCHEKFVETLKAVSNFNLSSYPNMRSLGEKLQISEFNTDPTETSCILEHNGQWYAEVVLQDASLGWGQIEIDGREIRMSDVKLCEMQLLDILSSMPNLKTPPLCMIQMRIFSILAKRVRAVDLARQGDFAFLNSTFRCSHMVHLEVTIKDMSSFYCFNRGLLRVYDKPDQDMPRLIADIPDLDYIMSVYQLLSKLAARYGVCTPFAEIFMLVTMREWREIIDEGVVVVHTGGDQVEINVIR